MPLGKDPRFERESRLVRGKRHEVFILRHYADPAVSFLADDVAEDATLFVDVILLGSLEFLDHVDRKNRQSNQLRVRALQRGSSGFPLILEDQDVLEAAGSFDI